MALRLMMDMQSEVEVSCYLKKAFSLLETMIVDRSLNNKWNDLNGLWWF